MTKKWIEMTITCEKDFLPHLTGLLMTQKIKKWVEEEDEENVRLIIYIPYFKGLEENVDALTKLLEVEKVRVVKREIDDEDWSHSWQRYFQVEHIGERVVVKPPWEDYSSSPGEIVIEIEPRIAFGSGFHPTTRLTMILTEKYIEPGMKVLDMGCGSGILTILAFRCGAKEIVAVDNDPISVREAMQNLKSELKNKRDYVSISIWVSSGFEAVESRDFDLAMVNINTDFIIENIENIASCMKPGGIFVTGSTEATKHEELMDKANKTDFEIIEKIEMDGWTGLTFRKSSY